MNVTQSQNIKIPTPLHAQLKALATKRGVTMVEVVHSVVRDAIMAGELPDEVPGLKVRLEAHLDGDESEFGPWVVITTPDGNLPRMTREDAEAVARNLCRENADGDDITHVRMNRAGTWEVRMQGTSIQLTGKTHDAEKAVEVILTPTIARDFARQVRRAAEKAAPDMED